MRLAWLAATSGAAISLISIAGLSFGVAIIMAVIDSIGTEKELEIWKAGRFGVIFGTIFFGLPVAIATGVYTWYSARKRNRLTSRCI